MLLEFKTRVPVFEQYKRIQSSTREYIKVHALDLATTRLAACRLAGSNSNKAKITTILVFAVFNFEGAPDTEPTLT